LGTIHLSHGPRQNGHRPDIDSLFRTAARACSNRVVGVILTGALDDGSLGLRRVKACGGIAVVQDPKDALHASMPLSALESTQVDYIIPLSEMADTLVRLVHQPSGAEGDQPMCSDQEVLQDDVDNGYEQEEQIVQEDKREREQGEHPDQATMLTCPECGGVLWELRDGDMVRFRCHVGHSYSAPSLIEEQSEVLESALWAAVRALEERAAIGRRMAEHAREQHRHFSASRFTVVSQNAAQSARIIRDVITSGLLTAAEESPEVEQQSEE
jgi:two-component system chemotaxis response regulator CheB